MSDKFSNNLSDNEKKIIESLRGNHELRNCFLEMIDIADSPLGKLDLGDDAEEAVVQAIKKTGKVLLDEWAQKKSDQATDKARTKPENHSHGKKKFFGTHQ